MYQLVGFTSVKIIGIDNSKRGIDDVTCSQHSLACSPWLYPVGRKAESCREVFRILDHEFMIDKAAEFGLPDFAEVSFYLFVDHENDLAKAGPDGIIYRIIDYAFSGWSNWWPGC